MGYAAAVIWKRITVIAAITALFMLLIMELKTLKNGSADNEQNKTSGTTKKA